MAVMNHFYFCMCLYLPIYLRSNACFSGELWIIQGIVDNILPQISFCKMFVKEINWCFCKLCISVYNFMLWKVVPTWPNLG